MALFKIFKGSANALLTGDNSQYAKEGYAWFTTDEGKLYIDISGNGTEQAIINENRIPVAEEVAISALTPLGNEDIWINSDTGEVLYKNPNDQWTNVKISTTDVIRTHTVEGVVVVDTLEDNLSKYITSTTEAIITDYSGSTGMDSSGNVISVNGKIGAVNLTASDVGARPNTWMPTANDVGARPNSWYPTPAQIDAVPVSRAINGYQLTDNLTLTANDVGARSNTWLPTAADIGAASAAELNEVKTSVSNGKAAVASAITDKGVSTSATASFDTMATNISAIPSGTPRSSSDLTISGATIIVPAGLYSTAASKSVASGTLGTVSASKSISGNTATITPKISAGTAGYNAMSAKSGTAITVTAAEVCNSGTKSISANGTGIDVTGYSKVNVNVPNPSTGTLNITENGTYNVTNYASVMVNVISNGSKAILNCRTKINITNTSGTQGFNISHINEYYSINYYMNDPIYFYDITKVDTYQSGSRYGMGLNIGSMPGVTQYITRGSWRETQWADVNTLFSGKWVTFGGFARSPIDYAQRIKDDMSFGFPSVDTAYHITSVYFNDSDNNLYVGYNYDKILKLNSIKLYMGSDSVPSNRIVDRNTLDTYYEYYY